MLINNAGLGLPTLFADAEPDQLARQLAVNLTAPLLLTRLCLPSLIERKGMIINIGSAITCVANSALGAYGATKAGLAYWNDALRRELATTGSRSAWSSLARSRPSSWTPSSSLVPAGGRAHPILDNAAPWMSADVEEVARRVARLLDHPRRRLSVPKRFVWPFRILGFRCSRSARRWATGWSSRCNGKIRPNTSGVSRLLSHDDNVAHCHRLSVSFACETCATTLASLPRFIDPEPFQGEVVGVDDGRDGAQLVRLSGLRIECSRPCW